MQNRVQLVYNRYKFTAEARTNACNNLQHCFGQTRRMLSTLKQVVAQLKLLLLSN